MKDSEEVKKLKAQLAEWDALLRFARKVVLAAGKGASWSDDLAERIDAALSASAEPSAPFEIDDLPPFARKVLKKLQRTQECFEDSQGTDIGRDWLDVLVKLGLLNRVQRSPALWEISDDGDALLEARATLERKT